MCQLAWRFAVRCCWEGCSQSSEGAATKLEDIQNLAEEELPESQCGFRRGRSCADMIFTVHQLVEMSWEHSSKVLLT